MIFFDHAAAESIPREVLDYHVSRLRDAGFVNQESAHGAGREAAKKLEKAGRELAALLGREKGAVCFAATGSDLFRILAATFGKMPGKSASSKPFAALTTALEHPAAEANLKAFFDRVDKLGHDRLGRVAARPQNEPPPPVPCRLTLIGAVNSELGLVQSPEVFSSRKGAGTEKSVLAVDFVQGAGKLKEPPEGDILLVSGHKFGAPGGAAMICSDPATAEKLEAYRKIFYGAGRADVPTQESMVFALRRRLERLDADREKVSQINSFLREKLKNEVEFTLPPEASSPFILHFSVPGFQSGVLLRMLSEKGVMCAAGSACQSESGGPSRVLKALRWSDKKAYSALRLSFSPANTLAEAEEFVRIFRKLLKEY